MSIKFAILGMLSWKSSTGYELKKTFEDSAFMHWSGNNNQIYKTLIKMQEEELVTSEIIPMDSSPSKKIYTITEKGLQALHEWVRSNPEAPDIRKTFLVQLAWADRLNHQELMELLSNYETEMKAQLDMQLEKDRRALHVPNRSVRERALWEMISDNLISGCRNELNWIRQTRQRLLQYQETEEKAAMNYEIKQWNQKTYVEFISAASPLSSENDALDLVALCGEKETPLLMIHYGALSQDFFDLKTRVAGNMIQKLINYQIKAAVVIPQEMILTGRLREMVLETNKGNHFRMYGNVEEAERWLCGGQGTL